MKDDPQWGISMRNAKVLHHVAKWPARKGPIIWTCGKSTRGFLVADANRDEAKLRCVGCCRATGTPWDLGVPTLLSAGDWRDLHEFLCEDERHLEARLREVRAAKRRASENLRVEVADAASVA